MPLGNIAMEARPIVDTQYSVYATNDAANDAANDRSHRTGIVLADARAVISALWYALSVCSGDMASAMALTNMMCRIICPLILG